MSLGKHLIFEVSSAFSTNLENPREIKTFSYGLLILKGLAIDLLIISFLEEIFIFTPGRTHNRIRSPRCVASSPIE